jgi:hypothetical protein
MIIYKKFVKFSFLSMVYYVILCSFSYASHKLAIDMDYEDLQKVSGLLRVASGGKQEETVEKQWGNIEPNSRNEVWICHDESNQRIFIAYPDVKSYNPFYKFLDLESEYNCYGMTGGVYKKAVDLEKSLDQILQDTLFKTLGDKCQSYEYIFAGYGLGGAAAVLAASRLLVNLNSSCRKYELNSDNRVKIINFSATKVGDNIFVDEVHQKIKLKNILHFQRHFDIDPRMSSQYVGIPLEITPIEGFYNNFFSRNSIILGFSLVSACIAKKYYFNNFIECCIEENQIIFSGYIMKSIILGAIYYLYYPSISSDEILMRAFSYAKGRNNRLEDNKFQKRIGSIGWLGTRS